jgi:hypothetical protein
MNQPRCRLLDQPVDRVWESTGHKYFGPTAVETTSICTRSISALSSRAVAATNSHLPHVAARRVHYGVATPKVVDGSAFLAFGQLNRVAPEQFRNQARESVVKSKARAPTRV